MVKAVHPGLRVGLRAVDWSNVVRLAEIVPGADLDQVEHVPALDDVVPASRVQVGVCEVDPLAPLSDFGRLTRQLMYPHSC